MLFCFPSTIYTHTYINKTKLSPLTHNLKRNQQQILKCKTKQRKAKTYVQPNKINTKHNAKKSEQKQRKSLFYFPLFLLFFLFFVYINRFWCKGKSPYVLVRLTVKKPLPNVWVAYWKCDSVWVSACLLVHGCRIDWVRTLRT